MAVLIEALSPELFDQVQKLVKGIDESVDAIIRFNKESKNIKLPSDIKGKFEATTKEIEKSNKSLEKSVKIYERQRKEDIKLQKQREQSFDRFDKQLKKEQKAREAQVNRESALRERLRKQRENEEKQNQRLIESTQEAKFAKSQKLKLDKEDVILSSKLATEYQKLVVKMNQAGRSVQNLIAKKEQGKRLSDLEQRELDQSTDKFNRYSRAVWRADQAIGRSQRNVGNYRSALASLGLSFSSLLTAFGLTNGILIFIDLTKKAFETVKQFNSGLLDVGKTTGLAGANLDNLGDDILDLSKKLQTVGVESLLNYATVAGQLGVKGTENILAFTEALAKLEVASDISGQEGGANIARLLTLVDGGVENIAEFGDEIVLLGNNFAATENEILKNATAIAQNTGIYKLGRKEVLAYATATKAVGIESKVTGSTIGQTLSILEKALRTGENIQVISDLTGKSLQELRTQFSQDSGSVFTDLVEGLNKVDQSGGSVNEQLEKLGITSVQNQRVIGSLATAGYETLGQALNDVSNATGSLDEEFDAASTKIVSQIDRMSIAWDNLILSIENGNGVIGRSTVGFVGNAAETMDKYSKAIEENTSLLDAWKLTVNNGTRTLSYLIPFVESGKGLFQEYTDALLDTSDKTEKLTQAISKENDEFIELNGSLAPMPEKIKKIGSSMNSAADDVSDFNDEFVSLNDTLEDYLENQKEIEELFEQGFVGSSTSNEGSGEEVKTVSDRIKELKDLIEKLNKEIGDTNVLDKEGIKIKRDLIKVAEKELEILEGRNKETKKSNKEREKELQLLKDYAEALNELGQSYLLLQKNAKLALENTTVNTDGLSKTIEKETELAAKRRVNAQKALTENELLRDSFVRLGQTLGLQETTVSDLFDSFVHGFSDAGEAAQQFGALFSDVLQGITAASNARIDQRIEGLELERDVAIRFAGDSASARTGIEEAYSKKVAQLKKKQAENEKTAAIISSLINTSVAVTEALPNVALAAIVGALGVAQTLIIASQPIPEFKDGVRNFSGGTALINEVRDEVVTTPDGRVFKPKGRNLFVDLPEGSNVFKSHADFERDLANQLNINGINPMGGASFPTYFKSSSSTNSGATPQQIENAFKRALSGRPTAVSTWDKNGIKTFIATERGRTESLNNLVTQKSYEV